MFANFLGRSTRQPPGSYDHAFVQGVEVRPRRGRTRLGDRLLVIGWLLILAKCAGTFWLIERYAVPFNGWWIAAPSLAAALACSFIYLRRR
jgi:hypothetical protein